MRHLDREHHVDLGIDPEADRTEDLRETAPELLVRQHQAGAAPNTNSHPESQAQQS